MTRHVSTFEVRALSRERGEHWTDEAVVLIDGADQLSQVGADQSRSRLRWMGLDPTSTIGPTSPLLAKPEPHSGFVARCSCSHLGCDGLTARIRQRADYVVWDQFRAGSRAQTPLDVPPFVFDAAAYRHSILDVGSPPSVWQPTTRRAALQIGQHCRRTNESNQLNFAGVEHLDDERLALRMRFGNVKDESRYKLLRVFKLNPNETADELASRVTDYATSGEMLNDPLATRLE